MKEENEEFLAILVVGGVVVLTTLLLGIYYEPFREFISYFYFKLPFWF